MEEDTYEPVRARPALGLPPPPPPTGGRGGGGASGASAVSGGGGASGGGSGGADPLSSRFSRFLDSIIGTPSAPVRPPYTDPVPRRNPRATGLASQRHTPSPLARRSVVLDVNSSRKSRAEIGDTLTPVLNRRRSTIASMPPSTPGNRAPPSTPTPSSPTIPSTTDELLDSLEQGLSQLEQRQQSRVTTMTTPRPTRRSQSTTTSPSQQTPVSSPSRALFFTPETGGGGSGGVEEGKSQTDTALSGVMGLINRTTDIEYLEAMQIGFIQKDRAALMDLRYVGNAYANTLLTDDKDRRLAIFTAIQKKKGEFKECRNDGRGRNNRRGCNEKG